jgi:hypothetical protein
MCPVFGQKVEQPGPREFPVPFHRLGRYREELGNFVDGHAGKKTKFDNPRGTGICFFQGTKGIIERCNVIKELIPACANEFEGDADLNAPPFVGMTGAGMVDDDLPHGTCSNAEKMKAIFPGETLTAEEFQEGLMDQVGREHRVLRTGPPKICGGNSAQFIVYQRNKPIQRLAVPSPGAFKNLSQFRLWYTLFHELVFRKFLPEKYDFKAESQ